ncbi:MAG: C4-dicarboxylate ABC transporter, partial [Halomonas sp.]|nr:C4-dicarboxylate ABC transporter [Halomonas sp.]
VVIGKNKLESMPEELQQVVLDAAKDMQRFEAEKFAADQQRLEQALKEAGMEFVEVDQQAFAERAKPAIEASLNEEQMKLYQAIQGL